jgi:WD40-like Beta Propeller Repeat.
VNGPDEDFDAAYLDDGRSLVFTRRTKDQEGADLWLAAWHDGRYAPPRRLGPEVNAGKGWNLGPSTTAAEPGVLFFSSHRPDDTAGRLDIYRIGYRLVTAPADAADIPEPDLRPASRKETGDRP